MTGLKRLQAGELIALREHIRAEPGVDASVRVPDLPYADLHNVVPFLRRRAPDAQAPEVTLPADAARRPAESLARERALLAAFAAVSLGVHAALFMAFWREPVPLASIGMEVLSVEIMVGATAPAGVATTSGEQQVQAAAAPDMQTTETDKVDERKPEEQKYETAAAPEAPAQAEQKPAIAMVETPAPDTATAKPQETPPPPTEVTLLPQPEEKPVETKVEPKPLQAAPRRPVKDAKPAREAKASTPSTAANNVGVGRSDRDTNYPGLVSAHLRRYQQYPSDARSRGDQGTASVSFGLDGGGRVTSARLVRGSGVGSIDQEVQAMVRRASPFPAPPDGRPRSFTVPIAFRLN